VAAVAGEGALLGAPLGSGGLVGLRAVPQRALAQSWCLNSTL
jgi:hypothetical protein